MITLDDQFSMKEIKEKPSYSYFVNAGIYALDPSVLQHIPQNSYFEMTGLFEKLKEKEENVYTFPILEYWMDVGQHVDFQQAESDYEAVF